MPLQRTKKFYKNQIDSIEELQDDLDSLDDEFAELKARKSRLKKKIKTLSDVVIDEGGEDLLREWEQNRAAAKAGPTATEHAGDDGPAAEQHGPQE